MHLSEPFLLNCYPNVSCETCHASKKLILLSKSVSYPKYLLQGSHADFEMCRWGAWAETEAGGEIAEQETAVPTIATIS